MKKTIDHLKWIFEFKGADVIFVTLLLAFLLTPTISSASNHELNDELGVIHQHIGFLMDENQNQNHEIALLKQLVGQQSSNDHHADPISTNNNDKQNNSAKKKRPARLLPFQYLYGEKNFTDHPSPPRFHGPPTNCSDLSKLGYTLNGFYMVKRPNAKSVDLLQLDSIFCAFKQPTEGITFDLASVLKKKAPISNSKPSGIHFYALKTESSPSQSTIITFEMALLNMGKAFDSKTSIFTVPISGIYQFIFRGALINSQYGVSKNKKNIDMELEPERISLMVNDRVVGAAADNAESPNLVAFSVMIEATLKLNRGDRVYLKPKRLSLNVAVGGNYANCTSFSGSLLIAEEDN